MRTLSVFEYGSLAIGEKTITRGQAKAIIALWQQFELPGPKPEIRNDRLYFKATCGLVGLGDLQIEILPKLCRARNEEQARQVLTLMLRIADDKPTLLGNQVQVETLPNHELLDVVINHYCNSIQEQARRGLLRRYVRRDAVLPMPRGKLLVSRLLREPRPMRYPCAFDQLDENNGFNRAVKYSLHLLHGKALSQATRTLVRRTLFLFEEVPHETVSARSAKRIRLGRSDRRWQEVLTMCCWFLADRSPNLFKGEQRGFSLLFPMHKLFEHFLRTLLREEAQRLGFEFDRKPKKHLATRKQGNKGILPMDPDYLFLKDGAVVRLMDAKWKLPLKKSGKRRPRPKREDLYQLYAYARFFECEELILFYPAEQAGGGLLAELTFNDDSGQLSMLALDLLELTKGVDAFREHLRVVSGFHDFAYS